MIGVAKESRIESRFFRRVPLAAQRVRPTAEQLQIEILDQVGGRSETPADTIYGR
jgi:hypothetical protein